MTAAQPIDQQRPSTGPGRDERSDQPTEKTVGQILEETRIVLPGTQTLFGFQLSVVFTQRFHDQLSAPEQRWHLVAMALVAVAAGLLIAPAAYHRQAEPHSVSDRFARLATRLVRWSMPPLLLGICIDFYLVATLITANDTVSLLLAGTLFATVGLLWFVLPRARRLQDALAR